jgi:Domain of unknown function (DUF6048)
MLVCCGALQGLGQAKTDTVATADTVKPEVKAPDKSGRHLSLGIDAYHLIYNQFVPNQSGYEFTVDYYLKNDLYLALEGGLGASDVTYSNLQYHTSNNFLRFGVNRSLLLRTDSADWNNMFIGARVAAANVVRGNAGYSINDSVWSNVPNTGSVAGRPFNAYWIELLTGVRVKLIGNISAGWNVRAKFMLNSRSFQDLAPLYIAGYGRGDKNSVFDFNFFLWYSINWQRKWQRQHLKAPPKK